MSLSLFHDECSLALLQKVYIERKSRSQIWKKFAELPANGAPWRLSLSALHNNFPIQTLYYQSNRLRAWLLLTANFGGQTGRRTWMESVITSFPVWLRCTTCVNISSRFWARCVLAILYQIWIPIWIQVRTCPVRNPDQPTLIPCTVGRAFCLSKKLTPFNRLPANPGALCELSLLIVMGSKRRRTLECNQRKLFEFAKLWSYFYNPKPFSLCTLFYQRLFFEAGDLNRDLQVVRRSSDCKLALSFCSSLNCGNPFSDKGNRFIR